MQARRGGSPVAESPRLRPPTCPHHAQQEERIERGTGKSVERAAGKTVARTSENGHVSR